jgi:hypothetical protein
LARFPAALRGSHSNSSANPHYTCRSKMVLRHRSVASFTGNCPHCPTAGRLDNWIGTDKPASHPERRFTPKSVLRVAGCTSRPAGGIVFRIFSPPAQKLFPVLHCFVCQ